MSIIGLFAIAKECSIIKHALNNRIIEGLIVLYHDPVRFFDSFVRCLTSL
jgi:hypothetical protein